MGGWSRCNYSIRLMPHGPWIYFWGEKWNTCPRDLTYPVYVRMARHKACINAIENNKRNWQIFFYVQENKWSSKK